MEHLEDVKYFSLAKLKPMVKKIQDDKKAVKELVKLTLGDDPKLSMRASWALTHVVLVNPKIVYAELPSLMKFFKREDRHTGAMRNVIAVFKELDLPEKYCGEIFDLCLKFTKNAALPHAVRAFSIITLGNICQKYPELKPEVELVFSELMTFPQPASISVCIRNARKTLKFC
jgi:hypothetical protein